MHAIIRFLTLAFLLLIVAQSANGQDSDSTHKVFLQTNLEEALVFADSFYLGKARQYFFEIPSGSREIKLVPPEAGSWAISPLVHPLPSSRVDTLELEINFPHYYKIESIPFDAHVYLEHTESRLFLGSTPLLYTSDDPLKGMLLLTSDGYESVRLTPGGDIWNQHQVELNQYNNELLAETEYWTPEKHPKRWIDYTAAGVALISGVLAIRYKTKANRRFDEYRISGDPALRANVDRYDRYAAVSLGAMQAGIGVLAIRLVIK